MKTAVVTGANGFIGSAVTRELLLNGYYVYALIHRNTDNIPEDRNLEKIRFSMEDSRPSTSNIRKCDVFFHFAWSGSAGPERGNVGLQLSNARGTVDAVKLAKKLGCKRFVAPGSLTEFEALEITRKKGSKPGLNYVYGGGKSAAHIMGKAVAADVGIDFLWGIITNAYGPGELSPRLVNTTIQKIINGESPTFTSGTQNYDFVYIEDVAKAFRLIGEKGKPFSDYVIGSSNARPLREFLQDMKDSIGKNVEFKFGDHPFEGIDLPLSVLDSAMTEKDTGFKASVDFKEGVRLTKQWLEGR